MGGYCYNIWSIDTTARNPIIKVIVRVPMLSISNKKEIIVKSNTTEALYKQNNFRTRLNREFEEWQYFIKSIF